MKSFRDVFDWAKRSAHYRRIYPFQCAIIWLRRALLTNFQLQATLLFWAEIAGEKLHKRILLLGPTGVDKAEAANRLAARMKASLGHELRYVDFENEYLKQHLNVKNWTIFLAQDIAQQATTWRRGWEDFKKKIDGDTTILGLHATYISGPLGLRSPVHLPSICDDFKPTLIISLIDDVYQMWSRTEARAAGQEIKGRPSFEQLLVARRAEQLLGDLILEVAPGYRTTR